MSIKRTIITTATIVVAVAMIASVAGAQTSTVAQLMAEITALQAQLQGLSGSTSTTTTTGSLPAACVGVTFTRNLVVGSVGSDVKCLQAILNLNASTQVSTTGAGSPGNESTYFGPKTLVAVRAWQVAAGFTPANQIGPMSRAKLNAWLGGTSSTTTTTTTTTGTQTGSVSATLASDTPASGAILGGEASADMLHINFTGSGTVTSVTLQRSGISDQNLFTNVYLYDGNTRLTSGYSFNVSGQIVINGLSIAVSGSHEISVRGDVECNAQAGICTTSSTEGSAAIALTGFTAGSTISANVMGNSMAVVSGQLATANLSANTVTSVASVNAGTTQYTVWSAPLQINTRSVMLKTAAFEMTGSAPTNALANINLYIDGVSTGKTATIVNIQGSSYAMFDLTSAPITLTTGSHTISVESDIVAGADRSIQFSLQQSSDVGITDPQVGVNIAVSGTPNNAAQINIAQGSATVNVDSTFSSQTNISAGATNAVIGRFTIQGYGEDVKINSITIAPTITGAVGATATATTSGTTPTVVITNGGSSYSAAPTVTITGGTCSVPGTATATISGGAVTGITTSGWTCSVAPTTVSIADPVFDGLNNVTLYFNGSQVGSQQNLPSTGGNLTFQLGSQAIAPAGQVSTLEVRADLQSAADVSYTAGSVVTTLVAGASNAQGQSSQTTFSVPTINVPTNGLTIQSSTIAVSANSNLASQSINPNTTGVEIGSYVVQNQSTSESVRLTQLQVGIIGGGSSSTYVGGSGCVLGQAYSTTTGAACYSGGNALTNLSALRTSDTTGSGSTPIQPSALNTFSVNDTLAPGAQMTINIFANTGSVTGGSVQTTLQVSSIGSVDNIAATTPASAAQGQTMSLNTGSIQLPSLIASTTTPSQYIASGANGATNSSQATFNFVSNNGTSTINEMRFLVTASPSTANPVTNICVTPQNGGTQLCAQPVGGVADITGLNLSVLNNGGLAQQVQVSYAPVGTSGLIPGTTAQISLVYVKSVSGGTTITMATNATYGNTCTLGTTGCITPVMTAVPAPAVTLAGSVPAVTVGTSSGTLQLSGQNQIGSVTVAASTQGSIRIHQIEFTLGNSGFGTGGSAFSLTNTPGTTPFIALAGNSAAITGSSCSTNSSVVTCTFASGAKNFANDLIIPAGQSQTFNLFGTVNGTNLSGNIASVSSTLTPGGFIWDDASYNGQSNDGVSFTDQTPGLIYNFPTNSYVIHQ